VLLKRREIKSQFLKFLLVPVVVTENTPHYVTKQVRSERVKGQARLQFTMVETCGSHV